MRRKLCASVKRLAIRWSETKGKIVVFIVFTRRDLFNSSDFADLLKIVSLIKIDWKVGFSFFSCFYSFTQRVKILMDKHSIIHGISILSLKANQQPDEMKEIENFLLTTWNKLNENKLDDFIRIFKERTNE